MVDSLFVHFPTVILSWGRTFPCGCVCAYEEFPREWAQERPDNVWIEMTYAERCSEHPRPQRFFFWSGANQVEVEEYVWLDGDGYMNTYETPINEEAIV